MIKIKRIYDSSGDEDGCRVLVDRLWPRGLSKESARVDVWMKEIAPSAILRKWFCLDTEKWEEFTKLYTRELTENRQMLLEIKRLEKEHKTVTLLYASKDTEHNQAQVLYRELKKIEASE